MTGEPYLVTTKAHMSAIIELHKLCFISDEQQNLHYALLDENCFSFLGGCDEDGQPTGYTVVRVQGKEAEGLWLGVRADRLNLKRHKFSKAISDMHMTYRYRYKICFCSAVWYAHGACCKPTFRKRYNLVVSQSRFSCSGRPLKTLKMVWAS